MRLWFEWSWHLCYIMELKSTIYLIWAITFSLHFFRSFTTPYFGTRTSSLSGGVTWVIDVSFATHMEFHHVEKKVGKNWQRLSREIRADRDRKTRGVRQDLLRKAPGAGVTSLRGRDWDCLGEENRARTKSQIYHQDTSILCIGARCPEEKNNMLSFNWGLYHKVYALVSQMKVTWITLIVDMDEWIKLQLSKWIWGFTTYCLPCLQSATYHTEAACPCHFWHVCYRLATPGVQDGHFSDLQCDAAKNPVANFAGLLLSWYHIALGTHIYFGQNLSALLLSRFLSPIRYVLWISFLNISMLDLTLLFFLSYFKQKHVTFCYSSFLNGVHLNSQCSLICKYH